MRHFNSKFDSIPDDGTSLYGVSEDALNQYGQVFNATGSNGLPAAPSTIIKQVTTYVGNTDDYTMITDTFEVPEECIGAYPIEVHRLTIKDVKAAAIMRSQSDIIELDISRCFLVNNYPNVYLFSPEILSTDKDKPAMLMSEVETDNALLLAHQVQVAPNQFELKVEWDTEILQRIGELEARVYSLENA